MGYLLRTLAALTAAGGLCACASTDQTQWAPRADANLAVDQGVCRAEADKLDIQSPREFTDGRYGVAAAMAARIDQQSGKGGTIERMRDAVYTDCMTRKGWTPA